MSESDLLKRQGLKVLMMSFILRKDLPVGELTELAAIFPQSYLKFSEVLKERVRSFMIYAHFCDNPDIMRNDYHPFIGDISVINGQKKGSEELTYHPELADLIAKLLELYPEVSEAEMVKAYSHCFQDCYESWGDSDYYYYPMLVTCDAVDRWFEERLGSQPDWLSFIKIVTTPEFRSSIEEFVDTFASDYEVVAGENLPDYLQPKPGVYFQTDECLTWTYHYGDDTSVVDEFENMMNSFFQ